MESQEPQDQTIEPANRGAEPKPMEADERQLSRVSKFLALVLRHRAQQFGLPVDDEGFVPLDELLDLLHEQDGLEWVERETIEQVGGTHVRRRFEVRGDRVRATYGHSFSKLVRYEPAEPPEELYAGLPKSHGSYARSHGLQPDGRQYVHLSDTREEAMKVGRRGDQEPDVIVVRAREASAKGIQFYKPAEGLFLCAAVPPSHLVVDVRYGRGNRRIKHRRARA
jgi:putative RNA 2'-phosphotransferase